MIYKIQSEFFYNTCLSRIMDLITVPGDSDKRTVAKGLLDKYIQRTILHINLVLESSKILADTYCAETGVDRETFFTKIQSHDADKLNNEDTVVYYAVACEKVYGTNTEEWDCAQEVIDRWCNVEWPKHWERHQHHVPEHFGTKENGCWVLPEGEYRYAITEMVCDWTAMWLELNHNTPTAWLNKNNNKEFELTGKNLDWCQKLCSVIDNSENQIAAIASKYNLPVPTQNSQYASESLNSIISVESNNPRFLRKRFWFFANNNKQVPEDNGTKIVCSTLHDAYFYVAIKNLANKKEAKLVAQNDTELAIYCPGETGTKEVTGDIYKLKFDKARDLHYHGHRGFGNRRTPKLWFIPNQIKDIPDPEYLETVTVKIFFVNSKDDVPSYFPGYENLTDEEFKVIQDSQYSGESIEVGKEWKEDDIKNITALRTFLSSVKYGFGADPKDNLKTWKLTTVADMLKNKIGTCYDTTFVADYFLKKIKNSHKCYFICQKGRTSVMNNRTHTFNLYLDNSGEWRWLEASWGHYRKNNFHSKSAHELVQLIARLHANVCKTAVDVRSITSWPATGCNMEVFVKHMTESSVISTIEPGKIDLKQEENQEQKPQQTQVQKLERAQILKREEAESEWNKKNSNESFSFESLNWEKRSSIESLDPEWSTKASIEKHATPEVRAKLDSYVKDYYYHGSPVKYSQLVPQVRSDTPDASLFFSPFAYIASLFCNENHHVRKGLYDNKEVHLISWIEVEEKGIYDGLDKPAVVVEIGHNIKDLAPYTVEDTGYLYLVKKDRIHDKVLPYNRWSPYYECIYFGSSIIPDKVIPVKQITKVHYDKRFATNGDAVPANKHFTRVTYDGIGVYEALKNNMTESEWRQFKRSDAATWLPAPSIPYKQGYLSYFTERGFDKFVKLTEPYIVKHLDKNKLEIKKYNISSASRHIVYSDKYQIVTDGEETVSTEAYLPFTKTGIFKTIHDRAKKHYKPVGQNSWEHIQQVFSQATRACKFVHKRDLNPKEFAAILYHDSSVMTDTERMDPKKVSDYKIGHNLRGAEIARQELADLFNKKDLDEIVVAIQEHDGCTKWTSVTSDLLATGDANPPDPIWVLNKSYTWGIKKGLNHEERIKNAITNGPKKYGSKGTMVYPYHYKKYFAERIKDLQIYMDNITYEIADRDIANYRREHHLGPTDLNLPEPSVESFSFGTTRTFENITSVEDLKQQYKSIGYGVIDYSVKPPVGIPLENIPSMEEFGEKWRLTSPEDLFKYGYGNCVNTAYASDLILTSLNIQHTVYCMFTEDVPGGHMFVVYKDSQNWKWIEASFDQYNNNNLSWSTERAACLDICSKVAKYLNSKKYSVWQFTSFPPEGSGIKRLVLLTYIPMIKLHKPVYTNGNGNGLLNWEDQQNVNSSEPGLISRIMNAVGFSTESYSFEDIHHNVEQHIKDNKVYHCSPQKYDKLEMKYMGKWYADKKGIFVTPFASIASCFIIDKQSILDKLNKEGIDTRDNPIDFKYDVWDKKVDELDTMPKHINVEIQGCTGFKPFNGKATGYLYTIDYSKYQDKTSMFKKSETSDVEFIINSDISPEKVEKISVEYTVHPGKAVSQEVIYTGTDLSVKKLTQREIQGNIDFICQCDQLAGRASKDDSKMEPKDMLAKLQEWHASVYAFYKANTMIGISMGSNDGRQKDDPPTVPDSFYGIGDIAISDEHQNKGYGQVLIRLLCKKIFDENKRTDWIALCVVDSNLRAKHVYETIGFKPIKWWNNKGHKIMMVLNRKDFKFQLPSQEEFDASKFKPIHIDKNPAPDRFANDTMKINRIDPSTLNKDIIKVLEKQDEYLEIVRRWLTVPDYSLTPKLIEFGKFVDKLYGFDKEFVAYRAMRIGKSTLPIQQSMGIVDNTEIIKKPKPFVVPGYKFTYMNTGPLSVTRAIWVSKVYGDLIVKTKVRPETSKLVITNELAYVLQALDEKYPYYRPLNLSALTEVLLFPDQTLNYQVVTTNGDILSEMPEFKEMNFKDKKIDLDASMSIGEEALSSMLIDTKTIKSGTESLLISNELLEIDHDYILSKLKEGKRCNKQELIDLLQPGDILIPYPKDKNQTNFMKLFHAAERTIYGMSFTSCKLCHEKGIIIGYGVKNKIEKGKSAFDKTTITEFLRHSGGIMVLRTKRPIPPTKLAKLHEFMERYYKDASKHDFSYWDATVGTLSYLTGLFKGEVDPKKMDPEDYNKLVCSSVVAGAFRWADIDIGLPPIKISRIMPIHMTMSEKLKCVGYWFAPGEWNPKIEKQISALSSNESLSIEALSDSEINKRKKSIVDKICRICDIIDPSHTNSDRYHRLLDKMSPKEFNQWMTYVKDGKWVLHIIAPNMIVNLRNENLLKAADAVGAKLFHRIWMEDHNTGRKFLTDNEYLVLPLPIRRQQQFLDEKMSVPEDDKHIDGMTGQVTGDSKSTQITNPEINILAFRGLDTTLEEMVNVRGGNMVAYGEFRKQAEETGEVHMSELDPTTRSRTAVIAQVLLNAMHIENNIV